MQHAFCRLENYFGDVAYASTTDERKRFFENLSELVGCLAVLFAKQK